MKIILAIIVVAAAVVLLCVGVILRKDGQFRSQHISQNKAMRERGITCVVSQDRQARKKTKKQ
ncbi:MAG: hypothetical protein J6W92_00995 [Paludibacteraceae bacterium]|nr:hypothetical protein [Paludibacteraceae bacterium]